MRLERFVEEGEQSKLAKHTTQKEEHIANSLLMCLVDNALCKSGLSLLAPAREARRQAEGSDGLDREWGGVRGCNGAAG